MVAVTLCDIVFLCLGGKGKKTDAKKGKDTGSKNTKKAGLTFPVGMRILEKKEDCGQMFQRAFRFVFRPLLQFVEEGPIHSAR